MIVCLLLLCGDYPERNISRYTLADDYHTIYGGCWEIAARLGEAYPQGSFACFVDSSPSGRSMPPIWRGLGSSRNG